MKKRMTILALLLAGAVTLGSYGMVQAGQEKREVPVAGVTQTLAQVLKEAQGVQAQTADAGEELQSNAAVARMMEPEMVAEEAWETAEIAENELPQTASEFADIAVAQVNHYVNVRQEPDTESEILGKLYDKSAATVLETTEDGWYRITSGNVNGYVKAEYVVVGDEELARSVGTRLATVTTTTLFVRTEPTTEAKVLTMLPDGDDVVVTDESTEGWAKVSTADGDGYVALDYVTLSTEYIHAESKAEEEARLAREEAERQAAARAAEEARKAREAEAARAAAEQEAARKAAEKQEVKKIRRGQQCGKQFRKQRGKQFRRQRGKRFRKQCGAKCADGFLQRSGGGRLRETVSGKPLCIRRQQPDKRNRLLRICQGRVCGIWNQSAAHIVGTAECGICRQPVGNPAGRHCLL